jgi:diguanylate cyclase (GGDEF)-like protein/PAS domain S-box-containing protein
MSGSTSITLRHILNEAIHTVAPETSLAEALRQMSERRISCVVVTDGRAPLGIFTEGDGVDLMARGERHAAAPISEFMHEPVLVTHLGMDHYRAYQLMTARNARHLVVVDARGTLLGLVTEGDLLHAIGRERLIQPKTVADAMTRHVAMLQEQDSLSAAARRMAERALSCVVVAHGHQPAGMLTERDVVRLFRESVDPDAVQLAQVMSQPLHTIQASELLAVAMRRMEQDRIRRLVVVDEKSALVGLLTRHDIVKTLQEQYLDLLQDTIERLERDLHITRDRLESVELLLLQRSVMDQVNDAVLVVELENGRIVEANEVAHELLDFSREELLALRCHEFTELFPTEAAWRSWVGAVVERGMQVLETRFRRKTGDWLSVEISARQARGGARAYLVVVARDITRRKQDETRIRMDREQQKVLKEILEIGIGEGNLAERLGRCLDRLLTVSWLSLLPKAGIFDLPPDGQGLRLLAARHLPPELLVRCARVALGECLCGRAAESGVTQFADCVDERHDITFPDMADHGHYSLPLRSGSETLGVLVLYLPHGHPHHREEQEFLEAVGGAFSSLLRRDQVESRLRGSEARIRLLLDSTAEAIFGVDGEELCTFVNRACLDLLGYDSPEDLLGRPIHHLIHHHYPDGKPYPSEACQALPGRVSNGKVHVDNEVFWRRDGTSFPVEYWSHPVLREGSLVGAVITFLDITQRRQSEEKLRLAAKVFENSLEGVMVTDARARILSVNPAFSTITGFGAGEVIGKTPAMLSSGRHDADFYEDLWRSVRETGSWRGEIWNRSKTGEVYPEWLSISTVLDDAGQVLNYVGVFSDISQIKQSEARLEHLAHHDPLTDLPNRVFFQSRLNHAIDVARRGGHRLGLLFLDMDGFKNINDSLGHPAGDELLRAIARRLGANLRAMDTLARLGGDEFVILLEDVGDSREAAVVAQNALALLRKPFQVAANQDVFIGASIGISLFPDDAEDATQLVSNADAALYQAKAQGRNTYRFYTEALTRSANERLKLESSLRRALEHGEFVLHYQPQMSIRDGGLVGAEALVRWLSPDGVLIPPARFIPLAEETGLIRPLGEWVLRTACAQFRTWRAAGLPSIALAVNLSSRQFEQRDLAARIGAILSETGFPAHRLELEITESAIMAQGEHAVTTLDSLKSLGVTLSIDDFGTGYSSLAYLKRFAVDKLKIDQSFIRDIPQNLNDREIAATIIAMARNLKLHVLAEGVETEEQLAFLRLHGCDAVQGCLFSPPVTALEFTRFLRRVAD